VNINTTLLGGRYVGFIRILMPLCVGPCLENISGSVVVQNHYRTTWMATRQWFTKLVIWHERHLGLIKPAMLTRNGFAKTTAGLHP